MVRWLQKLIDEQKGSSLSMEQAYKIMQEIDCEHKEADQYIAPWDLEDAEDAETEDGEDAETEEGEDAESGDGLAYPHIVGVSALEAGVRIKWIPVKDADGYYIYRKTSKKDWRLIKKTTRQKGVFMDRKAKPNRRYQYTIESYRDVGETRIFSPKEPYGIRIRTLKNR